VASIFFFEAPLAFSAESIYKLFVTSLLLTLSPTFTNLALILTWVIDWPITGDGGENKDTRPPGYSGSYTVSILT
jgi:hypothetical protein